MHEFNIEVSAIPASITEIFVCPILPEIKRIIKVVASAPKKAASGVNSIS